METTDTSRTRNAESGTDGESSRGTQADGAKGTRRKLNDQQEREVTRLYADTETPVSDISKRFGIGESSVYRVAQRHGAALRGRTSTSSTPNASPATGRPAAATGRGRRGRAPGTAASAKTASKTTTGSAKRAASTPSTNGRRTGAKRAAAAATPTRRTPATTRATRAPRGTRTAASSGTRQFRVSYTATRTFSASSMSDAIRQAEAAGATDITGIERSS